MAMNSLSFQSAQITYHPSDRMRLAKCELRMCYSVCVLSVVMKKQKTNTGGDQHINKRKEKRKNTPPKKGYLSLLL
jgi:hypothetical protein